MSKTHFFALLLLSVVLCSVHAAGQIPINDFQPITETFDSMAETNILPNNWLVSAPATVATWNTPSNTNTLNYVRVMSETIPTSSGSINWTCPSCLLDRTPGFMPLASYGSPNTLIAHYRNETGYPLNFVRLNFDLKQFRISNVNVTVKPEWSKDGINWVSPRLSSITVGPSGPIPTNTTATYLDPPNIIEWPASLPWLDLVTNDIPNGGDLYIRWVFTGETNVPHGVGIDNVTVKAFRSDPACRSITEASATLYEDFDSLSNSGNGDTLPNGFGYYGEGTNTSSFYLTVDDFGSGGLYSLGEEGSMERAFGSIYSSTFQGRLGACFVNNTGRPITSVNIKYDGETWRTRKANRDDKLLFAYSTDATNLVGGTWNPVASLNYTSRSSIVNQKDGNLPENRTAGIMDTIDGLNIPNGSTFYFRWVDFDAVNSSDDALAIDNFELTAFVPTAAGVSVSGRVAEANGMSIRGAVVTVSGGNLSVPRTIKTGTFGQYAFEGLSAGDTYFLSVRAPKRSFSSPTRSLNLTDSLSGIDFFAVPEGTSSRR